RALPAWQAYMQVSLENIPERKLSPHPILLKNALIRVQAYSRNLVDE
ncbi:PonA, partial [Pasteurella multocida subsp. multocida str. Anand1_buffalo]